MILDRQYQLNCHMPRLLESTAIGGAFEMRMTVTVCFLVFMCSFVVVAQQVEITKDGQHVLHLNPAQQGAADAFLKVHPELKLVSCPTLGPDSAWCKTAYANWEIRRR